MKLMNIVILVIIYLQYLITKIVSINDFDNVSVLVQKCCDANYVIKEQACVYDNSTNLNISVYENETEISAKISFVYNSTQLCSTTNSDAEKLHLQPTIRSEDVFFVQVNGTLWLPSENIIIGYDHYCIDYQEDLGITAIQCIEYNEPGVPLGIVGMAISLPFFLITFIVYALLPKPSLHGMCLMCYVFALFWAYLLVIITNVVIRSPWDNTILCQTIGKICYYFTNASYFWMNAISFHIWLTFSGIKGFYVRKNNTIRKRFLITSIYAWGVPFLMVIFLITLSYALPPDSRYNPGRGSWIFVDIEKIVIFYGPITVLVTVNIIFFVISAWKIKEARKEALQYEDQDSKIHYKNRDTQSFYLYLKLFVAMGINWSVPLLLWVITELSDVRIPYEVYDISNICEAAYGIFIFFTFVFKRTIWNSLKLRYNMTRIEHNGTYKNAKTEFELIT